MGIPLSPGAVLRCRRAHRSRNSVRPLRETSGWSSCSHSTTALHTRAHSHKERCPRGESLPRTVTRCLCECEWERESANCVCVQECIITDGNLSSPSRFPFSWNIFLFSSTKHRPHPGGLWARHDCLACPVLSCPGVGNHEDDSVVHFVLLSLTYELWAIFQNFSQGGTCRGWGGCSRGARCGARWCPSASNEPAVNPNKYYLLHATLISVLGGVSLEDLPVVLLVRFPDAL